MYYVSWYDALVFCNKLSIAEGLTPAYRINGSTDPAAWGSVPSSSNSTWNAVEVVNGSTGYRLPTEAQWEYAAKGGNGSPGNYTYAGSNTVGDVAWYSGNSGSTTHAVGTKAPNGLGLYDMSGNVYEWCWDWYGSYSNNAQTDPSGASSGSDRVKRGGYWSHSAKDVRSAGRTYGNRGNNLLGFRLARP
jgi:formylglycine-generating enzyme required for sulfatase activity